MGARWKGKFFLQLDKKMCHCPDGANLLNNDVTLPASEVVAGTVQRREKGEHRGGGHGRQGGGDGGCGHRPAGPRHLYPLYMGGFARGMRLSAASLPSPLPLLQRGSGEGDGDEADGWRGKKVSMQKFHLSYIEGNRE